MKMTWSNSIVSEIEIDEVAKQTYTEFETPELFISIIENNYYFRTFVNLMSRYLWDTEYMVVLPNNKLSLDMNVIFKVLYKRLGELDNKLLGEWQQAIIPICLYNQNFKEPYSNKNIFNKQSHQLNLHHALITKNDVKGLDNNIKFLIHNPLNCIVVDHKTHLSHPKIQDRYYNAGLLLSIYGEANKGVLERFLLDFPTQTTIKNYYANLGANNEY